MKTASSPSPKILQNLTPLTFTTTSVSGITFTSNFKYLSTSLLNVAFPLKSGMDEAFISKPHIEEVVS